MQTSQSVGRSKMSVLPVRPEYVVPGGRLPLLQREDVSNIEALLDADFLFSPPLDTTTIANDTQNSGEVFFAACIGCI